MLLNSAHVAHSMNHLGEGDDVFRCGYPTPEVNRRRAADPELFTHFP